MKKILFISGDKGGVGKTIVSRLLYDFLTQTKRQVAGYDCDKRNAQLFRHYARRDPDTGQVIQNQTAMEGITRLDIGSEMGLGHLLDDLEAFQPEFALVDLPAGGHGLLEKAETQFSFCEGAKELGYEVQIFHVLSRVKDSIHALNRLIGFFGNKVDYVAVKNGFFGDEKSFRRLDSSGVAQKIELSGGHIIYIPDLYDDILDLIDEDNLTFSEAKASLKMPFSQRSMLSSWLNRVYEQFEKVNL
jgi:hypothetical protein